MQSREQRKIKENRIAASRWNLIHLETALFAIVERMLNFSHDFRNLKFNEEFYDIVLCTCLLLYFSEVSKASRKSITPIFNEE
jgi:hypothetical protein